MSPAGSATHRGSGRALRCLRLAIDLMARLLAGRTCRPADDDELELVLVAFTLIAVLDQTVTTVEPSWQHATAGT